MRKNIVAMLLVVMVLLCGASATAEIAANITPVATTITTLVPTLTPVPEPSPTLEPPGSTEIRRVSLFAVASVLSCVLISVLIFWICIRFKSRQFGNAIINHPDEFIASPHACTLRNTDSNISDNMTHTGTVRITNVQNNSTGINPDKVQISAVSEKETERGEDVQIDIFLYEDGYRHVIDDYVAGASKEMKIKSGGYQVVAKGSRVTVALSSKVFPYNDELTLTWYGNYLDFSFLTSIPDNLSGSRATFTANVLTEGVLLCRLNLVVSITNGRAPVQVERRDIHSAFISYSSADREQVAGIVFGMKKARPDMDIFFDIENLSSGEHWERILKMEILNRDLLYLCWSNNAKKSEWVEREWRCAYDAKGAEGVEPIPLEPSDVCPPPKELSRKHFNDVLLYIIDREKVKNKQKYIRNLRTGASWFITECPLTIGRGPDNEIVIENDYSVSNRHCTLSQSSDGYFKLEDNSTNGTILILLNKRELIISDSRIINQSIFQIQIGQEIYIIF